VFAARRKGDEGWREEWRGGGVEGEVGVDGARGWGVWGNGRCGCAHVQISKHPFVWHEHQCECGQRGNQADNGVQAMPV